MALGRMPSAIRRLMSGILALAVAFRPLYLPAAFALAMPSRWRSNALRMSRHVPWRLCRSLLSGVTPVSDAATSGRRRETRQIGRRFHVTTDLPLLAFSNLGLTSRTLMLRSQTLSLGFAPPGLADAALYRARHPTYPVSCRVRCFFISSKPGFLTPPGFFFAYKTAVARSHLARNRRNDPCERETQRHG
jgi:hypothetical protein